MDFGNLCVQELSLFLYYVSVYYGLIISVPRIKVGNYLMGLTSLQFKDKVGSSPYIFTIALCIAHAPLR